MEIKTSLSNKTKELLARNPNWQKMADELIDHGLGYMSPIDHQNLVNSGAIRCNNGIDTILCDYPKLEIRKGNGEREHKDFNGNLNLLKQEMANNKGSKIVFSPRKYSEYIQNKSRSWRDDEAEYFDNVVKNENEYPVEGVKFEDVVSLF